MHNRFLCPLWGESDVARAMCTRLAAESGISDSTRYVNAAYYNSLFALVCSRAAGCSSALTADRRQLVCTVCTAPGTPDTPCSPLQLFNIMMTILFFIMEK